jgi:hypothetical protein
MSDRDSGRGPDWGRREAVFSGAWAGFALCLVVGMFGLGVCRHNPTVGAGMLTIAALGLVTAAVVALQEARRGSGPSPDDTDRETQGPPS